MTNSNTGKFHYAGCRYVNMMSPSHKVFYDNRDEAINAGIVPCKVCRRKVNVKVIIEDTALITINWYLEIGHFRKKDLS